MAGAIPDAGRAKLVGSKTFGTGTVLDQFNLSEGSALLLAAEEWLTLKGHSVWHKLITPDLDVDLSAEISPLLTDEEKDLAQQKLQATMDTQPLPAVKLLSGDNN